MSAVNSFLQKPRSAKGRDEEEGDRERIEVSKWPMWAKLALWCSVGGVVALIFGYYGYALCGLYRKYRGIKQYHEEKQDMDGNDVSFKGYLMYRFGYWFVWTGGSNGIIIMSVCLALMCFGTAIYKFLVGANLFGSLWVIFVWLVAPDAGSQEHTYVGATIGAVMSIAGLVMFALLLTLMQDSFGSYLDEIKNGRSLVMETNHTLLIGITDGTMTIIQELCKAYEVVGGSTIVVLTSTLSKPEMEDSISGMGFDKLGSRIVVRAGNPHVNADLKMLSADCARSIVIMSDREQSKETRDAVTMRTLVALRGQGWPLSGQIVAMCSLLRNRPLLQQAGGSCTEIVMLDSFVGKLMVQCSQHLGLGAVVKSIFGFENSEFYIAPAADHLAGKTIFDAALYYPHAVICGVTNRGAKSGCKLCPPNDYVLNLGDELVLLATDSSCTVANGAPCKLQWTEEAMCTYRSPTSGPEHDLQRRTEHIVVFGWNDKAGYILLELDEIVSPGTEILIVSEKSEAERDDELAVAQKRFNRKLRNLKVTQRSGKLGSRFMLEELPNDAVKEASRIFLLADSETGDAKDADTCTIGVLLQIRDMLSEGNKMVDGRPTVTIVPEIQDPESEMHLVMAQASDHIDTSGLPSQVLAMIGYNPRIMGILDEILSERGRVNFAIRKLQDYIQPGTEPPSSISFLQVQDLANHQGDVVIGWSTVDPEDDKPKGEFQCHMKRHALLSGRRVTWEMNPEDKLAERAWSGNADKLVVLTPVHT